VLSVAQLLGEAITRIHLNLSVSSLFAKGGGRRQPVSTSRRLSCCAISCRVFLSFLSYRTHCSFGEQPGTRFAIGFGLTVYGIKYALRELILIRLAFMRSERRIHRDQSPCSAFELGFTLIIFNSSGRGNQLGLPRSAPQDAARSLHAPSPAPQSIVRPAEKHPGRSGTITP